MSMIGNLARVRNDTRHQLHQSPELIMDLLYPEAALKTNPTITSISSDDMMDLDKAWHGLHFLFTGSDWEGDFPQGFLVSCGEPVGEVDVGYGPARSFAPDEVEAIAKFLDVQNEAELKQQLNPKMMDDLGIYPNGWFENSNPNEEWQYLADNFRKLKSFVKETAEKKMALLVYLN